MNKLPLSFSLVLALSTCAVHTMDQRGLARRASGLEVEKNEEDPIGTSLDFKNLKGVWKKRGLESRLGRLEKENKDIKENMQGQNNRIEYCEKEIAKLVITIELLRKENRRLSAQCTHFMNITQNSVQFQPVVYPPEVLPQYFQDEYCYMHKLPQQFWRLPTPHINQHMVLPSAQNNLRYSKRRGRK